MVPLVQGNLEDGSLVFGDALRGHAIERSVYEDHVVDRLGVIVGFAAGAARRRSV